MRTLCCLLLLLAQSAQGTTLQELVEKDQLRLGSWLSPDSDIVPGQEVQLTIEISTRRWFAGGTHIKLPEVARLVVLQRDQFATNLSRREAADTWVIQRWHLEYYPQRAGEFKIPPIKLELAVNDSRAGIVKGELTTQALSFTAAVPASLQAIDSWVATPDLNIKQTLDPAPQQLKPGDAFTREVIFNASNLPSMMLPSLADRSPPGLSAYPETPVLTDRSNRGEAIAQRSERIVYLVESAGQYLLPEQTFYWWDTANQQLEIAVLEAVTVDAGIGAIKPSAERAEPGPRGEEAFNLRWLTLLLLLPLGYALYRLHLSRAGQYNERDLLKQVENCLLAGHREEAVVLLYQWLNQSQPRPDWIHLRDAASERADPAIATQISALLDSVFGPEDAAVGEPLKARRLAGGRRTPGFLTRWLPRPIALDLNPVDEDTPSH